MRARSGFTLVEILIVVIILGILAAIVIPQFSDASTQARETSIKSDLWTMRSQIELYKVQHKYDLPTDGGLTFPVAMTSYTTVAGVLAAVQAPADGVYGPYLRKVPTNRSGRELVSLFELEAWFSCRKRPLRHLHRRCS